MSHNTEKIPRGSLWRFVEFGPQQESKEENAASFPKRGSVRMELKSLTEEFTVILSHFQLKLPNKNELINQLVNHFRCFLH